MSVPGIDDKKLDAYLAIGVRVIDVVKVTGAEDANAKFFSQFAMQCFKRRFTIGDLAARKLPLTDKGRVTFTFRDQDSFLRIAENSR